MNPWEQILQRAIADSMLLLTKQAVPVAADLKAFIKAKGLTLENVAEAYIDRQIETGNIPFPVSLYRSSLISAANSAISELYQKVVDGYDPLFNLVEAWAKDEATKLGA